MHDQSFDIISLHSAYASGAKPEDVIAECYRRIRANGDPGIFLHLIDEEAALAEAHALGVFDPEAKPLWGIPFAIKDNIDVAGAPTTAACPAFTYRPGADSYVVAKLREAGAIPIGKTNLDQFATGLVGVRTPHPVPKNAIDPEIVPGGSSAGSAVSVALGLVGFSLGTDTAGSGRVPAALNNIVGVKPSLGLLSATGSVPACRTLDTISIFALTAEDGHRVLQAAAGYDPKDAYSRDMPVSPLAPPPEHLRIGVPDANSRKFFGDSAQAESFEAAIEQIKAFGAQIEHIDLTPFYQIAEMLYEGVWVAERNTVVEPLLKTKPDAVHPVIRTIVSKAEGFSATDTFRSFYRMEELRRMARTAMEGLEVLLVPTIPSFCTVKEISEDPIGPNSRLGTYTNFVNLLDLCGVAVPTPTRTDGRPGNVTLLAKAGADALLAGLAAKIHRAADVKLGATDWAYPATEPLAPAAGAREITIAAVGAHMSGLPLNTELTRLGARYLKTTRTDAGYRLYRLAGGPPARPGLVRDEKGASIEVELWAMPEENFGAFMRGIPSPLGIGTVTLECGETTNGFICESAGLDGASDITEYGGWRNFLASLTTTNNHKPITSMQGEQHAEA
ncbi:allophanate hydrolase [Hwanghaeella grinnelliae]|uniref:Allophanate hydrolase n=1 Tax=Hwanghaeella grinnelliae TaxID=2500179 RepID=A0A437QKS8_9PROT|nr:allophanate hydrolase [Hwanghaeella grinnelliae]RVU35124.1 allophanate hydrolase [Hwanghaeella grinnelliae]